jgi:hypothetical protein
VPGCELLCWSFAFPVSWRPVPGGKGFPVMLPEQWKEENNCMISFWKVKQPNRDKTEPINRSQKQIAKTKKQKKQKKAKSKKQKAKEKEK